MSQKSNDCYFYYYSQCAKVSLFFILLCSSVHYALLPISVLVLAWHSGDTLDSINVVTLRRARLVPGCVTIFGQLNHLGTESGTQVDSA